MDGRGGCCTARYSIGSGQYDYNFSKADRIMLRFRPIAPKPTTDGGGSHGVKSVSSGDSGSSDVSVRSGRGKRKCQENKEKGGNNTKRCTRRRRSEKSLVNHEATAVTLSLLPETPDQGELKKTVEKQKRQEGPFWLSFSDVDTYKTTDFIRRRTVVISSCMTVERVTDAWIDGYGLGRSDQERKMNLVRDTCPGFISDDLGRVTWTNDAYRKMARDNIPVEEGVLENTTSGGDSFHVVVRLVMKERPMFTYPAFTCRVKLQYTYQDRERGSVTVPCDVWRMDCGGFAWRLDVKAALCL